MEQEILQLKSEQFNGDEYWELLKTLIEQDAEKSREIIPLLARQSVARIIPFIGADMDFNFWEESKQLDYLASVLVVGNFMNGDAARYHSARTYAANNAVRTYAANDANDIKEVICVVASVADYAAKAVDYAANTNANANTAAYATNAAAATAYAYAAADSTQADLFNALKRDVELAQQNVEALKSVKLWVSEVPDWFVNAVKTLEAVIEPLRSAMPVTDEAIKKHWQDIDNALAYYRSEIALANTTNNKPLRQSNFSASNQYNPEAPAATDKLNRQNLVNALAENLVHPANHHPRAIALLGEWGSGKSTVLSLLKNKLKECKKTQPFIFGEFNAWAYEHSNHIQAGVAQEVLNAVTSLPKYEVVEKVEGKKTIAYWWGWSVAHLGNTIMRPVQLLLLKMWITLAFSMRSQKFKLLKCALLLLVALLPVLIASHAASTTSDGAHIDWFLWLHKQTPENTFLFQVLWAAGFGVYFLKELRSVMANPLSKELLTYIRLPDYAKHLGEIPVMRENIKTMCEIRLHRLFKNNRRLLFVVDDLDRCSPEAIVKVLEAVRLVLELENVVVVIAVDQHIVLAALSKHFKDFSPHHKLNNSHAIARDYLSKVINLPIVLTAPNKNEVKDYMEFMWSHLEAVSEEVAAEEATKEKNQEQFAVEKAVEAPRDEATQPSASVPEKLLPEQPLSNSGVLTQNGLASKQEEPVPPVKTLSLEKQKSFVYWVNYFELSNPRQLKRLNNSYDVMRSYFKVCDSSPMTFSVSEKEPILVYPMLLTLILMEYLNSLDNQKLRSALREKLFSIESNTPETAKAENGAESSNLTQSVNENFINAYRKLRELPEHEYLAEQVETFVLPAMAQ